MDANLTITGTTRIYHWGNGNTLSTIQTLVNYAGTDHWITEKGMETLSYFTAQTLMGHTWTPRMQFVDDFDMLDPQRFYYLIFDLRRQFQTDAIIRAAKYRGLFSVGAEKSRIKVDPAILDNEDPTFRWRIRHLVPLID